MEKTWEDESEACDLIRGSVQEEKKESRTWLRAVKSYKLNLLNQAD